MDPDQFNGQASNKTYANHFLKKLMAHVQVFYCHQSLGSKIKLNFQDSFVVEGKYFKIVLDWVPFHDYNGKEPLALIFSNQFTDMENDQFLSGANFCL